MAFTEASADGILNGTGRVTMVAAPGAGTRRIIKTMTVCNVDSVTLGLTVSYTNAGQHRTVWSGVLNPGDTWMWGDAGDVMVLDGTSKSVTAIYLLLDPPF